MSRRLRTAIRVVLIVIASVASLVTVGGLGTIAVGLAGTRVVTESQTLPNARGTITVETGDVPVAVRLVTDPDAREPRIDLRLITRNDGAQLAVNEDQQGSQVTLRNGGYGFLGFNGSGDVTVVMPSGRARDLSITIKQRAGSLSSEADLDRLVSHSDGGTITLGGSARVMHVYVRHGDINTTDEIDVSESFHARTDSGSISAQFRTVPRNIDATARGDVKLRLPGSGPYRVRAESSPDRGTMVTVPQTPAEDAPGVTARSENGNVEVTELR